MVAENNSKQKIIVTGGAGYIGSITCALLKQEGYEPVIIDNFSTSRKTNHFSTYEVDLSDFNSAEAAFKEIGKATAIIHFAAFALVGESVETPFDYFSNNINSTLNLSELARKFNIPNLIHSSSCSVYGIPKNIPINEDSPLSPISPYAESKRINEYIINQFQRWKNIKTLHLRYFNPAGASIESNLGEEHNPETHLIPNIVTAHLNNTCLSVFGNDYPTPDGTCIRDFIHVQDLAKAHLIALKQLQKQNELPNSINIGTGIGTSIKEAISIAEQIFKTKLKINWVPRREGDAPELIADVSLMKKVFNWEPKMTLAEMLTSHLKFTQLRLK